MSERRQVWQTLAGLVRRLEQAADRLGLGHENGPAPGGTAGLTPGLETLEKEVRKLGKAQFKANTIGESQVAQFEKIIADLKQAQAQEAESCETIVRQRVTAARQQLVAAFLPALDSVEQALASGQRYLALRDRAAARPDKTAAQARLVSPADRTALAGWLAGLRLTQERLLAILAAEDVTPIPTVGHPFDPYLHKAVGVTANGSGPAGVIVAEERTGYRSASGVLRYADVVVYRPHKDTPQNEQDNRH
jgi:molecular chaperone GrpE (heat shock protein)